MKYNRCVKKIDSKFPTVWEKCQKTAVGGFFDSYCRTATVSLLLQHSIKILCWQSQIKIYLVREKVTLRYDHNLLIATVVMKFFL